jgi:hypothetical protein
METNSAKLLSPIHQGDLQTQVGGMKSSCVTARTCTDHHNIGLYYFPGHLGHFTPFFVGVSRWLTRTV